MPRNLLIETIENSLIPLLTSRGHTRKVENLQTEIKNSDIYKIVVVGTTGAGKSTFLNALLGKSLLPSREAGGACTGVIVEIENSNATEPEALIYDRVGNVIKKLVNPSQTELLRFINSKEGNSYEGEVSKVKIVTPIPYLNEMIRGETNEDVELVFIDTPGYDTNQDTNGVAHTDITFNIIKDAHLLLSFWDFNKPGRNTSREILEVITSEQDYSDLKDKVYIILNKIEGNENIIEATKEQILANLNNTQQEKLTALNLTTDKILEIGALGALYCRMYPDIKKSQDVDTVIKNIPNINREQENRLGEFNSYLKKLERRGHTNLLEKQLELSNIENVERTIANFLNSSDLEAKILKQLAEKAVNSAREVRDEIAANLAKAQNSNKDKLKNFKQSIEKLNKKKEELEKDFQLESTKTIENFEKSFGKKYNDKNNSIFNTLQRKHKKALDNVYEGWTYKSNKNTDKALKELTQPVVDYFRALDSGLKANGTFIEQDIRKEHSKLVDFFNNKVSEIQTTLNKFYIEYGIPLPDNKQQLIKPLPKFSSLDVIEFKKIHFYNKFGHRGKQYWPRGRFGYPRWDIHIKKEAVELAILGYKQTLSTHINVHFNAIKKTAEDSKVHIFNYFQKCINHLSVKVKAQLTTQQTESTQDLQNELTKANRILGQLEAYSNQISNYKKEETHV